ncbi:hypothetical protein EPA93_31630 [Ktedonosporobacter rubrisoli]|uniref:Uncharacterized protein n=1 Tax=Ktedonosporobacter rubrisoli TaxID=2509675 RepID=A0A4V0YZM9_KTERU|nr:hypothetical protein [Ktedonosporobacter rubrisoli]QBD80281.1 hypothetical protein EPA93_31630 [Ktedonosporobacter rubrisoli]
MLEPREYLPVLAALNATMNVINTTSDSTLFTRAHILYSECLSFLQRKDVPVIFNEERACFVVDTLKIARRKAMLKAALQV